MAKGKHSHDDAPTPAPAAEVVPVDSEGGDAAAEKHGAKVRRTAPAAEKPASDEPPPPKFGTAYPAGEGEVPRVVNQLARAGEGQSRYKISCRNYSPQPTRYILARSGDESGAVACYLKSTGLDSQLARLKKRSSEVEEPELVVTELSD